MKCFFHHTVDAVAVCRGCGKAVCRDCQLPTVNDELVCGTECEVLVKRRALIERKMIDSIVGNSHGTRIVSALARFAAGLAFLTAVATLCVAFLPQPFFGRWWPRNVLALCLEAAVMVIVTIGLHLLAIALDRVDRRMADGLDELKPHSTKISMEKTAMPE